MISLSVHKQEATPLGWHPKAIGRMSSHNLYLLLSKTLDKDKQYISYPKIICQRNVAIEVRTCQQMLKLDRWTDTR